LSHRKRSPQGEGRKRGESKPTMEKWPNELCKRKIAADKHGKSGDLDNRKKRIWKKIQTDVRKSTRRRRASGTKAAR